MQRRSWPILVLATALTFGLTSVTLAESSEAESQEDTAATENTPEAAPIYGMQAWKDAETGGLRAPTAEEAAEMSVKLRELFGKAKSEPRMFQFKNGMLAAEIDPSMFRYSVVRVGADGHLEAGCVHGTHGALEFIETVPSTPALEEE